MINKLHRAVICQKGAGVLFALVIMVVLGVLVFTAAHLFSGKQSLRDTFLVSTRLDAIYIAESAINESFQYISNEMNKSGSDIYTRIRKSDYASISLPDEAHHFTKSLCLGIEAEISINMTIQRQSEFAMKNGSSPLPADGLTPGNGEFEGLGYIEVTANVSFGKSGVFGKEHSVQLKERRDYKVINTRYSKMLQFGLYSRYATEQFRDDKLVPRWINDYNKSISVRGECDILFGNGDDGEGAFILDMPPGELSKQLENCSSKRYLPKINSPGGYISLQLPYSKLRTKTWQAWMEAAHQAKNDVFIVKIKVKGSFGKTKTITEDGWDAVKYHPNFSAEGGIHPTRTPSNCSFKNSPGGMDFAGKFSAIIKSGGGWGKIYCGPTGFVDTIIPYEDLENTHGNGGKDDNLKKYFSADGSYRGHVNYLRSILDGENIGGKKYFWRSHYLSPRDKAISIGKNQKKIPLDLEWDKQTVYGKAYGRTLIYSAIYYDYEFAPQYGNKPLEAYYAFPVFHDSYTVTKSGQYVDRMNHHFMAEQYNDSFIRQCIEHSSRLLEAELTEGNPLPFKMKKPDAKMAPGTADMWKLELGLGIEDNKISYIYDVSDAAQLAEFKNKHVKNRTLYLDGLIHLKMKPGTVFSFTQEGIDKYSGQGILAAKSFEVIGELRPASPESFLILAARDTEGHAKMILGDKPVEAVLVCLNGLGKKTGKDGFYYIKGAHAKIKGALVTGKLYYEDSSGGDFYAKQYKTTIEYDTAKIDGKGSELSSATASIARRAFMIEDMSH